MSDSITILPLTEVIANDLRENGYESLSLGSDLARRLVTSLALKYCDREGEGHIVENIRTILLWAASIGVCDIEERTLMEAYNESVYNKHMVGEFISMTYKGIKKLRETFSLEFSKEYSEKVFYRVINFNLLFKNIVKLNKTDKIIVNQRFDLPTIKSFFFDKYKELSSDENGKLKFALLERMLNLNDLPHRRLILFNQFLLDFFSVGRKLTEDFIFPKKLKTPLDKTYEVYLISKISINEFSAKIKEFMKLLSTLIYSYKFVFSGFPKSFSEWFSPKESRIMITGGEDNGKTTLRQALEEYAKNQVISKAGAGTEEYSLQTQIHSWNYYFFNGFWNSSKGKNMVKVFESCPPLVRNNVVGLRNNINNVDENKDDHKDHYRQGTALLIDTLTSEDNVIVASRSLQWSEVMKNLVGLETYDEKVVYQILPYFYLANLIVHTLYENFSGKESCFIPVQTLAKFLYFKHSKEREANTSFELLFNREIYSGIHVENIVEEFFRETVLQSANISINLSNFVDNLVAIMSIQIQRGKLSLNDLEMALDFKVTTNFNLSESFRLLQDFCYKNPLTRNFIKYELLKIFPIELLMIHQDSQKIGFRYEVVVTDPLFNNDQDSLIKRKSILDRVLQSHGLQTAVNFPERLITLERGFPIMDLEATLLPKQFISLVRQS